LANRDWLVDLAIFVETNAKNILGEYKESEFYLPNYNLITANFMQKHLRGIFCYIKHDLRYNLVQLKTSFKEYLCFHVNDPKGNVLLSILVIYRSPHSVGSNDSKLIDLIKEFVLFKSKILIIGDFNFPNINWDNKTSEKSSRSAEQKFLNVLNDNFLNQLVCQPTRFRANQKSNILDLLIVRDIELINKLLVISPIGKSDHSTIKFEVIVKFQLLEDSAFKYNFDKGNYISMNKYINNLLYTDFNDDLIQSSLITQDTLNNTWSRFHFVLASAIDLFVPLKNSKKKFRLKFPIYLNDLIKKKNNIWRKYVRSKDIKLWVEYKTLRNKIKKNITLLKQENPMFLANKIKSNPKVFWQMVKNVSINKNNVEYLIDTNDDGKEIKLIQDVDKAKCFVSFFKSVYIDCNNLYTTDQMKRDICISKSLIEMENLKINPQMIYNKLCTLDKYKSAGADGLFSRVFVECASTISRFLCHLFQWSLKSGFLPGIWKSSVVVPIYKKGNRHLVNNYRPVSLCCVACKLLEHFVKESLLVHFNSNGLFNPFNMVLLKTGRLRCSFSKYLTIGLKLWIMVWMLM